MLYADVAEYSRLNVDDEDATQRGLSAHLEQFGRLIPEHGGRLVHTAGDAVLAEYATVSDALACALQMQTTSAALQPDVPQDRLIRFRIGLNLGEVIVDDPEIYGNGVNIAARMESIADPGGICVSGTFRDAISNRAGVEFESLGEQQVKNIREPVRVFRVLAEGEVARKRRGRLPRTA